MAGKFRDVKRRIKSVQSTKKITKAMELIAASRIVRAERRVRQARPFSERLGTVIRNLAATSEQFSHPMLELHDGAPAALVVFTADRGLAGAYNANVLRSAERLRRDAQGAQVYAIGRKAISAFRFRKVPLAETWSGFTDSPSYAQAVIIAHRLIDDFTNGTIGSARLVYTEFVSMFTQRPVTIEILPVSPGEVEGGTEYPPVYEFEPDPAGILNELLPMYVEMKVFHALLEAAASEHAARRRAMSSASDNADGLITSLTREANRLRQAEITMEIADIVGGAEALRK